MSEHILRTIADLQAKLREHEAAATKIRGMVNQLCEIAGDPPIYDVEDASIATGANLSIRADQFYGQPLATCMRDILEMRRARRQGPASVTDLYNALVQGGFSFDTKNEENAKRGLRVSLTKNTALFHRLPNGLFGLLEWYPNARSVSRRRSSGPTDSSDAGADEDADDGQSAALEEADEGDLPGLDYNDGMTDDGQGGDA